MATVKLTYINGYRDRHGKKRYYLRAGRPPGTFDALAVSYYRSPQFLSLSAQSQRTYRFAIDRWRKDHGTSHVAHRSFAAEIPPPFGAAAGWRPQFRRQLLHGPWIVQRFRRIAHLRLEFMTFAHRPME